MILAQTYLPHLGGAEVHTEQIAKWLARMGNKVVIVTPEKGVASGEVRVVRTKGSINSIFGIPIFFREIMKLVKDYDLINSCYSHRLSVLAVIIGKLYRKPVVLTLHGTGTIIHEENFWSSRLIERLMRWICLKLATAVIAPSEEIAGIARKFMPAKKIFSIPNGVDTGYFHPMVKDRKLFKKLGLSQKESIVMTMRRLEPKNGVQFLVEVAPLVLAKNKDVRFCLVGKGRIEDVIKERVVTAGLEEYFLFCGEAKRDEVRNYLSLADVVVFPSTAEATSLAASEAMAMEKPVVATKVGGFVEMIGDNARGILVDVFHNKGESHYAAPERLSDNQKKLMAEGILEALNDREMAKKRAGAARAFLQINFDWKVIAGRYLEVFEGVR